LDPLLPVFDALSQFRLAQLSEIVPFNAIMNNIHIVCNFLPITPTLLESEITVTLFKCANTAGGGGFVPMLDFEQTPVQATFTLPQTALVDLDGPVQVDHQIVNAVVNIAAGETIVGVVHVSNQLAVLASQVGINFSALLNEI
jgi:hypothetical protein